MSQSPSGVVNSSQETDNFGSGAIQGQNQKEKSPQESDSLSSGSSSSGRSSFDSVNFSVSRKSADRSSFHIEDLYAPKEESSDEEQSVGSTLDQADGSRIRLETPRSGVSIPSVSSSELLEPSSKPKPEKSRWNRWVGNLFRGIFFWLPYYTVAGIAVAATYAALSVPWCLHAADRQYRGEYARYYKGFGWFKLLRGYWNSGEVRFSPRTVVWLVIYLVRDLVTPIACGVVAPFRSSREKHNASMTKTVFDKAHDLSQWFFSKKANTLKKFLDHNTRKGIVARCVAAVMTWAVFKPIGAGFKLLSMVIWYPVGWYFYELFYLYKFEKISSVGKLVKNLLITLPKSIGLLAVVPYGLRWGLEKLHVGFSRGIPEWITDKLIRLVDGRYYKYLAKEKQGLSVRDGGDSYAVKCSGMAGILNAQLQRDRELAGTEFAGYAGQRSVSAKIPMEIGSDSGADELKFKDFLKVESKRDSSMKRSREQVQATIEKLVSEILDNEPSVMSLSDQLDFAQDSLNSDYQLKESSELTDTQRKAVDLKKAVDGVVRAIYPADETSKSESMCRDLMEALKASQQITQVLAKIEYMNTVAGTESSKRENYTSIVNGVIFAERVKRFESWVGDKNQNVSNTSPSGDLLFEALTVGLIARRAKEQSQKFIKAVNTLVHNARCDSNQALKKNHEMRLKELTVYLAINAELKKVEDLKGQASSHPTPSDSDSASSDLYDPNSASVTSTGSETNTNSDTESGNGAGLGPFGL